MGQPSLDMTDERSRKLDQSFRNPAGIHEIAREKEKRDRKKPKGIEHAHHIIGDDKKWDFMVEDQNIDNGGESHAKEDGRPEKGKRQEGYEKNEKRKDFHLLSPPFLRMNE